MLNSIALQTATQLIFLAEPQLGLWCDPSALTFSSRVQELSARLQQLGLTARALDLLAVLPGA